MDDRRNLGESFTSINVHEYNVCILFYYVCFMLENRKHEKIDSLRDEE